MQQDHIIIEDACKQITAPKPGSPVTIFTADLSLPDQDGPSPPSKSKRAANPIINTAAHTASSGNPTLSYIHPKPANFFSPSATLFSKYSTSRPEKCISNLTNSALILKNNSFAPPAPLLLKTQDYISASISNSTWRNYSAALSSFQKFEPSTNISNPWILIHVKCQKSGNPKSEFLYLFPLNIGFAILT